MFCLIQGSCLSDVWTPNAIFFYLIDHQNCNKVHVCKKKYNEFEKKKSVSVDFYNFIRHLWNVRCIRLNLSSILASLEWILLRGNFVIITIYVSTFGWSYNIQPNLQFSVVKRKFNKANPIFVCIQMEKCTFFVCVFFLIRFSIKTGENAFCARLARCVYNSIY